MSLIPSCNLLLVEEGMHPDSIFVDRGEGGDVYKLPELAHLL